MARVSTLAQALNRIDTIGRQQNLLNSLTTQIATGKKTQEFSGLDTQILTSKRARADFNRVDQYIDNIRNADRRINLTLAAIEEFQAQARNLANFFINFPQESANQEGEVVFFDDPLTPNIIETTQVGYTSAEPSTDLKSLQQFASGVIGILSSLLNETDTDRFLLAGANTDTQPFGDTALLDTAITSLIDDWKNGTISTNDLVADIQDRTTQNGNADALTDTIVGFSSGLSAGNTQDVFVRTDDFTEVSYTVLANEDPFRDIMVVASTIANGALPPIADQVDPDTLAVITQGAPGADVDEMKENFFQLFNEMGRMINQAIDDIDQIRFRLENTRVQITETLEQHEDDMFFFQDIVSNVEDIDPNEVAVQTNALSVQLEASLAVTARTQQLSLVNVLN